jgi:hypothetical protein
MGEWLLSRRDSLIVARHEARSPGSEVPLEFGHLEAGFRCVPEGHAIVARRFIAGLALNKTCVPEGRLKLDPGTSCLATIVMSLRDKTSRPSKRLAIILA